MIERAEEIRSSSESKVLEQWSMFIKSVILISSESFVQRPVIGLDRKIVEKHISNLPFDQSITNAKKNNLVQRLSFIAETTKK